MLLAKIHRHSSRQLTEHCGVWPEYSEELSEKPGFCCVSKKWVLAVLTWLQSQGHFLDISEFHMTANIYIKNNVLYGGEIRTLKQISHN